ncbi:MAG: 50S ribosomal protein L22 [Candidatus Nanohaloarchaea archaeon]
MGIQTEPHQAKAVGKNLRISWKDSTEIGRFIKGDTVEKAKNKLEKVTEKKLPVPYTKFDSGAGHRSGNGKAKYPVKAAETTLEKLEEAESNAENEGLNPGSLKVKNVISNQGPSFQTPKNQRGRELKSTHLKIIVEEQ